MPQIFGGLWLENLVRQDEQYDLQCELFASGFIRGIQLRVAHPGYTPSVTTENLPQLAQKLPDGMKVFVHFGAENVGVDWGERLDEQGAYAEHGHAHGISWRDWNRETILWGQTVARVFDRAPGAPLGVAHPGYGLGPDDVIARSRIVSGLLDVGTGSDVALETVPPVADRTASAAVIKKATAWPDPQYWGFGGTPRDMKELITDLGPGWKCFYDWSHLIVMSNQARFGAELGVRRGCFDERWQSIDNVVEEYLELPHWPICQYSGAPEGIVPVHDCFPSRIPEPVLAGLREMEVICLEIPWDRWTASDRVRRFQDEMR